MLARIPELRQPIETELQACAPGLTDDFPVTRYLAAFDALPTLAPYHRVPDEAHGIGAAIVARAGEAALEHYHRLAMLNLIERSLSRPDPRLTPEVSADRDRHFARMVSAMEAPRNRFYRLDNDLFAKDFALCRGKLVPCGVELADLHSGVSRRILLRGGPGQFLSGLGFLGIPIKGFRPFFETHFDRRLIDAFDAAGYVRLYRRLAGLMAREPAIRGVISSSWWHDPALARISPELDFIDREPLNAGARLFRVGEDSTATADATRFAPDRSALYKRGEYKPQVWMLVWARRDLLAWADRQPGDAA